MQPEQQQRILGYFLEEAREHLNTIEQGLLKLNETLNDPESINEVFRAAHSIKGGAAMLGLSSIQHTAHRLEDCFKVLKEHPVRVDEKLESLFLGVCDTLKALLDHLGSPFGLGEEVANNLMSETEPVLKWLTEHLQSLVEQGGDHEQTIIQPFNRVEVGVGARVSTPPPVFASSAATMTPSTADTHSGEDQTDHLTEFQAQVLQTLREMLQLFKQPSTPESRRNLQQCCQRLVELGTVANFGNWCGLCQAASSAIANPENTYLTLAKIVITEIKQAHELVLQGRNSDIAISQQLASLLNFPEIELLELSEPEPEAADLPLESSATVSETTEEPNVVENKPSLYDQFPDTLIIEREGNRYNTDDLFADDETQEPAVSPNIVQNGPEVGLAELSTLADLFEVDSSELDETWHKEENLDPVNIGGLEVIDSEVENQDQDLADLLSFDEELSQAEQKTDDSSEALNLLFEDNFLDTENLELDNQTELSLDTSNSDFTNGSSLELFPADFAEAFANTDSETQEISLETVDEENIDDLFGIAEEAATPELSFGDLESASDANLGTETVFQENIDDLFGIAEEAPTPELSFGDLESASDANLGTETIFQENIDDLFGIAEEAATPELSFGDLDGLEFSSDANVVAETIAEENIDDLFGIAEEAPTPELTFGDLESASDANLGTETVFQENIDDLFGITEETATPELSFGDLESASDANLGTETIFQENIDDLFGVTEETATPELSFGDLESASDANLGTETIFQENIDDLFGVTEETATPELSFGDLESASDANLGTETIFQENIDDLFGITEEAATPELAFGDLESSSDANLGTETIFQENIDDLFGVTEEASTPELSFGDLDGLEFSSDANVVAETIAEENIDDLFGITEEAPTPELSFGDLESSSDANLGTETVFQNNETVFQENIDDLFGVTEEAATPELSFGDLDGLEFSSDANVVAETIAEENIDDLFGITEEAPTPELSFGDLESSSDANLGTETVFQNNETVFQENIDDLFGVTEEAATPELSFGDLDGLEFSSDANVVAETIAEENIDDLFGIAEEAATPELSFGDLEAIAPQEIPSLNVDNLFTELPEPQLISNELEFGDAFAAPSETNEFTTTIQDFDSFWGEVDASSTPESGAELTTPAETNEFATTVQDFDSFWEEVDASSTPELGAELTTPAETNEFATTVQDFDSFWGEVDASSTPELSTVGEQDVARDLEASLFAAAAEEIVEEQQESLPTYDFYLENFDFSVPETELLPRPNLTADLGESLFADLDEQSAATTAEDELSSPEMESLSSDAQDLDLALEVPQESSEADSEDQMFVDLELELFDGLADESVDVDNSFIVESETTPVSNLQTESTDDFDDLLQIDSQSAITAANDINLDLDSSEWEEPQLATDNAADLEVAEAGFDFESELNLTEEIAEESLAVNEINSETSFIERDAVTSPELASAPTATDENANQELGLDEFAELEALLDEPPVQTPPAAVMPDADFAALEALLGDESTPATPPPTPVMPAPVVPRTPVVNPVAVEDEFSDLEKLLAEADQSMSHTPAMKGNAGRNQRPTTRRVTREETMKIPVKQLDDMSNLVGELVVNRNTLEQDHERLRQSLDNLLVQVQHLSDVGARMQELYERSLLESSLLASRRTRDHGHSFGHGNNDRGFSELEMDRFTPFHTLSQEMIEFIVRVRESASDIDFVTEETERVGRQFRQVTTQLQEGLTKARMVPFAQAIDRLRRGVRDNALKYGKQVELQTEGAETLIDKMILDHLTDPLTHMLNNAIAHGIETPEVRQAAGKTPTGVITIRAFHQGNQTVISVSDDGAGIDIETVKAKAIKKGIVTAQQAQTLSRQDFYDILFLPSFSTADQIDDIKGRGVGMDVVRTDISEIRGVVSTDSAVGKGTTFTIRLPLTLSICKALCCVSEKSRIAFPMDGIEDTVDIPSKNIHKDPEGNLFINWRDSMLPFKPLKEILAFNRHLSRGSVYGGTRDDDMVSVIVLRSGNTLIGLQVDLVLSEQEIVIKQFEGPAPKPSGVAGATVLGDGRIMPIADVLEIIDIFQGKMSKQIGGAAWQQKLPSVPEIVDEKIEPTVLIVDDSITVRELLSLTFNKAGYRVEQARDGQEAWDKLRSGLPCDIVFCDIEMPRCDGLELLSRIQKDSSLNHLPIAMLTSRGADKHKQMAVQLGASGYFTKPYLEEALLEAASRILKGEKLVTA
jgi:chemotaxis protein histidine kinase CheA/CheY-like chemotaxis protein